MIIGKCCCYLIVTILKKVYYKIFNDHSLLGKTKLINDISKFFV